MLETLIKKYGGTASVTTVAVRSYDPVTDTFADSAASVPCSMRVQQYTHDISPLITAGTYKGYVTPDVTIKEQDTITWNSEDYKVLKCFPHMNKDGTTPLYFEVAFAK